MPYRLTTDIIAEALFRGGEPTDGTSDYATQIPDWVDRGYQGIATGTLEAAPETHIPWWWLWSPTPGVITLQPNVGQRGSDGTVGLSQGSTSILFSHVPANPLGPVNLTGWNIKFLGSADQSSSLDVFRIASHTLGLTSATLDSPYTGPSNGAAGFNAFNVEYDTPADLLYIVAPLRAYQTGREQVEVVSKHALENFFPLTQITFGIPNMACFISEQRLRFSHYVGAGTNTAFVRIDFDYLRLPPTLTGAPGEEPLLPIKYRSILADYGLQQLYVTKNDDRAPAIGELIRGKITAMRREHLARMNRDTNSFGRIYPRQQDRASIRGPWRTESGFILSY